MFIFALLSIPVILIIFTENFNYKKIIYFFVGIVFSQFISIIFWSLGTLYIPYSDYIIYKLISFFIPNIIPLLLLFSFIGFNKYNLNSSYKLKEEFVYGFLYWNMFFSLIIDKQMSNGLGLFIMPLFFMIIVFFYHHYDFLKFNKYNLIIHRIITFLLPLIIVLAFVLINISYILAFIFLFLLTVLLFFTRRLIKNK